LSEFPAPHGQRPTRLGAPPRAGAGNLGASVEEVRRVALGLWLTAAAVLRRGGRTVAAALDRLERAVVPALLAAGHAVLRAVDNVEGAVVPTVQGAGRAAWSGAAEGWSALSRTARSAATEGAREARRGTAVLATETGRGAQLQGQALVEGVASAGRSVTASFADAPALQGGRPRRAAAPAAVTAATPAGSGITAATPAGSGITAAAAAGSGITAAAVVGAARAAAGRGGAAAAGRTAGGALVAPAGGSGTDLPPGGGVAVLDRPVEDRGPGVPGPGPDGPGRHRDDDPPDFLPGPAQPAEPTAGPVLLGLLRGEDRRADVERLLRSFVAGIGALLLTAAAAVVAVALVAQAAIPRAVDQASGTVSAELIVPEDVDLAVLQEPSSIFANDGSRLARLSRNWNRTVVPLAAIPPMVRQAVITAEDGKFYEHDGYDPQGIGRATLANLTPGGSTQGASTITQQLAKSILRRPGDDRITILDKLEEINYAVGLERTYSKDVLLEQYLNYAFFGRGAYGIAAAAETFFGVTVDQLTIEQAALLATMIRAPITNDPDKNPDTALYRRNVVITDMAAAGYIEVAQAEVAKATRIETIPREGDAVELPFVVDAVMEEFLSSPTFAAFGETREQREAALWEQGLELHATVDRRLQGLAEETLRANFTGNPDDILGALATVDPATGRILAAASAWPYTDATNFNLAYARRQPGSVTKPFVYAAALAQGFPVSTPLSGTSPTFLPFEGWREEDGGVENYGGRSYGQALDMRSALTNSVNTATVQLSTTIGIQRVVDLMGAMGVDVPAATEGETNDAIALGGFRRGMTPIEAASAYGTFANNGTHVQAHWIDRIVDRDGNEAWNWNAAPQRREALQPQVNATMVDLMRNVVTSGTARRAQIPGWPVAGKTGTTSGERDAWFVGYTPTLSTSMWYGYRRGLQETGETGGGVPARIWNEYMTRALEGQTPVAFPEVAQGSGVFAAGQPTTVPDVRTLPQLAALQQVTAAQLSPEIRAVPSNAPLGTILDQSPRGGTPAQSGQQVTLTVSNGEPPAPPPPARAPGAPAPGSPTLGEALIDLLGPRGEG